jgi:hypothetical protein
MLTFPCISLCVALEKFKYTSYHVQRCPRKDKSHHTDRVFVQEEDYSRMDKGMLKDLSFHIRYVSGRIVCYFNMLWSR